jgi:hypothetical protein
MELQQYSKDYLMKHHGWEENPELRAMMFNLRSLRFSTFHDTLSLCLVTNFTVDTFTDVLELFNIPSWFQVLSILNLVVTMAFYNRNILRKFSDPICS